MKQSRSKKILYQFLKLGTILILLLPLYGCNPNSSTQVIPSETKKIAASITPLVTTVEVTGIPSTSTSTITPTFTPRPTITNSATPEPTLTPHRTPGPTLSYYQSNLILYNLYQNNGNCKLPCWFGITPGVTSWWDARNFLQPFSRILDWTGNSHYIYFDLYDADGGILLTEQEGIIDFMYIGEYSSNKAHITLPRLLTEYGRPDKVYVNSTIFASTPSPFVLVLYYQRQNILAKFILDASVQDNKICAYPQYQGPQLSVWADDSQFELPNNEFPKWILGVTEKEPLPIERATNMDVEKFYLTFRNSKYGGTICTPVD